MKKRYYYILIKFDRCIDYNSKRLIWYFNGDHTLCDCINCPFDNLEETQEYYNDMIKYPQHYFGYSNKPVKIEMHYCYKW